MHFLNIVVFLAVVMGISAHPVAVLPKVVHPPVDATKDYSTSGTGDVDSDIQIRDEGYQDIVEPEPGTEARIEAAAIDAVDLKSEDQAGDGSHIQARDEDNVDTVDQNTQTLETRDSRRDNDRGRHVYKYANSRASRGEHNTRADDRKYRDNLVKLDNNNCGPGCLRSLDSHRSVAPQDSRLSRARQGKGYYRYGYPTNTRYEYRYPARSSRASRGEHNTPADDRKYRDNLAKFYNNNCGTDCLRSLDSYRSVASLDSRLSRARKDNYYYRYDYDHRTKAK